MLAHAGGEGQQFLLPFGLFLRGQLGQLADGGLDQRPARLVRLLEFPLVERIADGDHHCAVGVRIGNVDPVVPQTAGERQPGVLGRQRRRRSNVVR